MTNLLQFIETVTVYVDQGYPVDVIFVDFQKAFDKVPHGRLLLKVKVMGIGSQVANWIESWLSDRKQRVVINGKYSGWSEVVLSNDYCFDDYRLYNRLPALQPVTGFEM